MPHKRLLQSADMSQSTFTFYTHTFTRVHHRLSASPKIRPRICVVCYHQQDTMLSVLQIFFHSSKLYSVNLFGRSEFGSNPNAKASWREFNTLYTFHLRTHRLEAVGEMETLLDFHFNCSRFHSFIVSLLVHIEHLCEKGKEKSFERQELDSGFAFCCPTFHKRFSENASPSCAMRAQKYQ